MAASSPLIVIACLAGGNEYEMKLSAKFARQEDEETRLARVTRRRVPEARAEAIRRMLGLTEPKLDRTLAERSEIGRGELSCPKCHRRFRLAMHLGRHLSATHQQKSKTAAA